MMIILKLILIQAVVVYIIDLSGAIEDLVEPLLARIFNRKSVRLKKPFSCSTCTTWWLGLLYIAINSRFTIPYIALTALLSWLTPVMKNLLIVIKELLIKALDTIALYFHI